MSPNTQDAFTSRPAGPACSQGQDSPSEDWVYHALHLMDFLWDGIKSQDHCIGFRAALGLPNHRLLPSTITIFNTIDLPTTARITNIPPEVLHLIFRHLDAHSLLRFDQVRFQPTDTTAGAQQTRLRRGASISSSGTDLPGERPCDTCAIVLELSSLPTLSKR